jgi:hypothetical protein
VAPKPFPGKRWPTRVAWHFEIRQTDEDLRDQAARLINQRQRTTGRAVADILHDADIQALARRQPSRRLSYIGKPNRYRALEAQRFLQRGPGERLHRSLEVEFDRGGVVFSRVNGELYFEKVHMAYHPHSGSLGPIDGFARKTFAKRVGGHTVYSYKDKLAQEEIDAFYEWYEKSFKRKLKRPRGKALAMKEHPDNALDPMGNELA